MSSKIRINNKKSAKKISIEQIKKEFKQYDNFGDEVKYSDFGRQSGVIKNYLPDFCYGFIEREFGSDLFFSRKDFTNLQETEQPQKGDEVKFIIKKDSKGKKAIKVTKVL